MNLSDGTISAYCPPGTNCENSAFTTICNFEDLAALLPQENDVVFPACDPANPDAAPFFVRYTRDEITNAIVYVNVETGATILPVDFTVCPEVKTIETDLCVDGEYAGTRVTCFKMGATPVTTFIGADGAVAVEPVGATPCEDKLQYDLEKLGCIVDTDGVTWNHFIAIDRVDPENSRTLYYDGSEVFGVPAGAEADWTECLSCADTKVPVDTCFLPDQYAIIWAWNGSGDITSYDPLTGAWTDWGKATYDGNTIGGFALAFKNDESEPTLYFQRSGNLYKSDPTDPTNLTLVGPASNTAFNGSYPCLAFDPSGRLLVGIGSGSTVGEMNESTGAVTTLGPLIDVRDGATAVVGPGDWFFDPSGKFLLMATDNRGATFGQSTGTVLWEIDPSTLEITRVGETPSPSSGTGAAWLASNQYVLSTGADLYVYNALADVIDPTPAAWELLSTGPRSINDLANQWVIPDAVQVVGWVSADCSGDPVECDGAELFVIGQNAITGLPECQDFPVNLRGKFGVCTPEANPFVTDPFSPTDSGSGCETCPDQEWNTGCSDAGATLWRRGYDASGNVTSEYLYGSLTSPTNIAPSGFDFRDCEDIAIPEETVTAFCDLDAMPNRTVYRKETSEGIVTWFDETGPTTEPPNIVPGSCETDSLLPVSEQIICLDGSQAVRLLKETYVTDAEGLPVLTLYQVVYFDENGTIYDSGVLAAGDPLPAGEPEDWYLGDCQNTYVRTEDVKLCEVDARFLLLIDSGGSFARYSFYTGKWENVSTLSVASAGGSTDVANFRLYNFVAPDQMTTIDVNTDTQLPNITLTSGVLKPGLLENPLTFSAASFRDVDGFLYAQDTAGADAGLYRVDPATGIVDFVTEITGVVGTGTSIMIDNTTDTLVINGTNLSYDVDWVTGVGTVWGDPPLRANGATFDTDGNAYVTAGNDTYQLLAGLDPNDTANWVQIIDDWTPGANSLAYYEVVAQQPSCFFRRFGVLADGTREVIGDFNVADDSPRTVVGDVDCCECACGGGSGEGSSDVTIQNPTLDVIDVTPKPDQTHVIVHGVNTNVPAGLKAVTINSLSGTTLIDGTFEIGGGRRPEAISYGATESDRVRALLPEIVLSGGTWQWTGVQPVGEI